MVLKITLLILFGAFFGENNLYAQSSPENKIQGRLPTQVTKKRRPPPRRSSYLAATLGYIWWQETLDLITPSGTRHTLVGNTNGPCIGLTWLHRGNEWDYSLNGCVVVGFTDVSSQRTIDYFQQSVETYGIIVGPGLQFRPDGGKVSLGIQLPLVGKYTSWAVPSSAYKVSSETKLTGGALLDASWRLQRYVIHQKVGFVYSLGWTWLVQLERYL